MPIGKFLLCLHSHMPYVLSHGKSPHGTDWINESAAECYLPLLHALDRLAAEDISPRWTVNITPILAEQLEDPEFKSGFESYCQSKIEAAREDEQRFRSEGPLWMQGLAEFWQRRFAACLEQFQNRWSRSIVQGFRRFQDDGRIEIITSCATHGYLPLLGTDESCSAQVAIGVESYRRHFDRDPRGIWLPECAYRPAYDWKAPVGPGSQPWERKGVEEYLAAEGIEYFFVDSHMIRGGEPLGTYADKFPQLAELFARGKKLFTPPPEHRSEYEHYSLGNGVACFARDPQTTVKVWSGDMGYPGDEHYLEFHKQLYPGRLRYWRISQNKRDLGSKQPYDPYVAFERIGEHAEDFVRTLKGALSQYRGRSEREGTLVAMYDTELFGHWWFEGPEFLYEVARAMHHDTDLRAVSGGDVLDEQPARHHISLPEGSWGEGGYHYIWLNEENSWTWERLYPAQQRLRELVQELGDGEILIQAARELLLAESSDWQFLISTFAAKDYAELRFTDHMDRFDRLCDLAAARGELSPDDVTFLAECQEKDNPFAWLDLTPWKGSDATPALVGGVSGTGT